MEIRNYTNFWNIDRKFYSFQDVKLPIPVSIRVVGVFAAVAAPWFGLMFLLHVPFSPGIGPIIWISVPAILAFISGKPWFEGKTLIQNLHSRISYLFENKRYKRLEPDLTKYDKSVTVEQNVIVKKPLKPSPFN